MPDFHPLWQDIPIYSKTYELYKTFYGYLYSFPRKDRYSFGQRCEKVLLDLLEAIITASNLTKQEKLPVLKQAGIKVDLLKMLFRLGKDIRVIEIKKYQELEQMIDEIGKMVGGWIKTTQS